MKKRVRLFLTILVLVISIFLLVWGYWPAAREVRIQSVAPGEMQLP